MLQISEPNHDLQKTKHSLTKEQKPYYRNRRTKSQNSKMAYYRKLQKTRSDDNSETKQRLKKPDYKDQARITKTRTRLQITQTGSHIIKLRTMLQCTNVQHNQELNNKCLIINHKPKCQVTCIKGRIAGKQKNKTNCKTEDRITTHNSWIAGM